MALPPTALTYPGSPRKKFRLLGGESRVRPVLDLREPGIDTNTGVFNIGTGTATPWQYSPDQSPTPAFVDNKVYGHVLPTTTGTSTAYVVTYEGLTFAAYTPGLKVLFLAHVVNGPGATMAVGGGPPKPLYTKLGTALASSTLLAGALHEVCYDGFGFRVLV